MSENSTAAPVALRGFNYRPEKGRKERRVNTGDPVPRNLPDKARASLERLGAIRKEGEAE